MFKGFIVVAFVTTALFVTTFAKEHRQREYVYSMAREAGYLCGRNYSTSRCMVECAEYSYELRRRCEYGIGVGKL